MFYLEGLPSLNSSTLEVQTLDDMTLYFLNDPSWLLHDDFVLNCNVSLLICPPVVLVFRNSTLRQTGFFEMDWAYHIH